MKRPRRETEMKMMRMRIRAIENWVWGFEEEEGSLGMGVDSGEEVAMSQMAGTEGIRAMRVSDMARRPSFETPMT